MFTQLAKGDVFAAFINYGRKHIPFIKKMETTLIKSYTLYKTASSFALLRVTLKYSLFYYWQYFLVVFKVLYREHVYIKTGYHLGRK